jgi:hypothetical protein
MPLFLEDGVDAFSATLVGRYTPARRAGMKLK